MLSKGDILVKLILSTLSGCPLPAPCKTALKKTRFALFSVERRPTMAASFPPSSAGRAGCVHKGWRGNISTSVKKPQSLRAKQPHLALGPAEPHQLSWFSLIPALFSQAGLSLSPSLDKSCSSQIAEACRQRGRSMGV